MMPGIRKTKIGIVCKVSLIGRRNADTRSFSAAHTPRLAPRMNEMRTPAPQSWIEIIACGHMPVNPMNARPPIASRHSRQPPAWNASNATIAMNAGQGRPVVPK